MIGTTELILIAIVVVVLFGSAAIPKFARSIGQAKKEFEKGIKEGVQSSTADDKEKKAQASDQGALDSDKK